MPRCRCVHWRIPLRIYIYILYVNQNEILHNLLQKMKEKEILPNSIYETNVTLIPKTIQKQDQKKSTTD